MNSRTDKLQLNWAVGILAAACLIKTASGLHLAVVLTGQPVDVIGRIIGMVAVQSFIFAVAFAALAAFLAGRISTSNAVLVGTAIVAYNVGEFVTVNMSMDPRITAAADFIADGAFVFSLLLVLGFVLRKAQKLPRVGSRTPGAG